MTRSASLFGIKITTVKEIPSFASFHRNFISFSSPTEPKTVFFDADPADESVPGMSTFQQSHIFSRSRPNSPPSPQSRRLIRRRRQSIGSAASLSPVLPPKPPLGEAATAPAPGHDQGAKLLKISALQSRVSILEGSLRRKDAKLGELGEHLDQVCSKWKIFVLFCFF
jgi:hypothetical protein